MQNALLTRGAGGCATRQRVVTLVQFSIEILVILSPRTVLVRVVANQLLKVVNLGIEVVQMMERNGLERHREFRRAEFIFPVMTDNHVFEPQGELQRKFLAG